MQEPTTDQPLVSIIMSIYNCEAYIEAAINSIREQTYKNLEIIVIDDASTDKTAEVVARLAKEDPRIRPFYNEKNIKQTRTRNFGVSKATGEFVGPMDGDDIRVSTSIEKQLKYLQEHPDVVAVGTGAEICDVDMNHLNDRLYPTEDAKIKQAFFRYSPFCLASLLIRKEALDKPDAYKVYMEPAEDIDLGLRLGERGKLANLPDVLYRIRTHKASVSQTQTRVMEKKTLYLRIKAVFEFGYHMTLSDKLYFGGQLASMYLMPQRLRFWLFNKVRSSKRS